MVYQVLQGLPAFGGWKSTSDSRVGIAILWEAVEEIVSKGEGKYGYLRWRAIE
jgi:hypothetical protein